ncbi:hypothetical protein STEG23_021259 [Scotinomys teguina]
MLSPDNSASKPPPPTPSAKLVSGAVLRISVDAPLSRATPTLLSKSADGNFRLIVCRSDAAALPLPNEQQ